MKVLVLENIHELDAEISAYIDKEHSNDDVRVVYGMMASSKNEKEEKDVEVIENLRWCDIVCMQSTFSNRDQLHFFAKFLTKFENIKDIRIIFTLNNPADNFQLLKLLNVDIDRDIYSDVVKLMKSVQVTEIVCKTVILEKQEYFDKHDILYDIVPLYYNKKHDKIWHTRRPVLDRSNDDLYLNVSKSKSVKTYGRTVNIDKEDVGMMDTMFAELRTMIECQIESCILHDFDSSKELIKEKEEYIRLMDKYKL